MKLKSKAYDSQSSYKVISDLLKPKINIYALWYIFIIHVVKVRKCQR